MVSEEEQTEIKLCECGCGQPAPIAKYSDKKRGYIKGQPVRFINGHQRRNIRHQTKEITKYPRLILLNNGIKISEHRFIVEEIIGFKLPEKAVIHHIDCNSNNNNPSNFVVCDDTAYHGLLHQRTRALKECGNANWRKCPFCKKYDDPKKYECKG
jgi:hypothetical protein